jgi:hypothetical protein
LPHPLCSLFTAALFTTLLHLGNMAGEWIVGGVEAKGFAYALLLLALESLVRERWRSAWLYTGAATAFHVLVGGWSMIALAWTWLTTDAGRRLAWRRLLPALAAAGMMALAGLLPALALSRTADADVVRGANRIYVFERLSHHLVFHALPVASVTRHVALLLAWLFLARQLRITDLTRAMVLARLNRFIAGAVLIAAAGAVLDQSLLYFPSWSAALLRFYWFRLSDIMVPMGATFALALTLASWYRLRPTAHTISVAVILMLLTAHVGWVAWRHTQEPFPGAFIQSSQVLNLSQAENERRSGDWQRACDWIARHTRTDDMFLTPRHQQSFKWYAQRGEVICAKDIPQDAAGIVEWRRRLEDVFPGSVGLYDLVAHREQGLLELAKKYQFQYVVVDRGVSQGNLAFPLVYPNELAEPNTYEVYRVPRPAPPGNRYRPPGR